MNDSKEDKEGRKILGIIAFVGFILIIIGSAKDGVSMLELGLVTYVFAGAALRNDWGN